MLRTLVAFAILVSTHNSASALSQQQEDVMLVIMTAEAAVGQCTSLKAMRDVDEINELASDAGVTQDDFRVHGDRLSEKVWTKVRHYGKMECAKLYQQLGPDGLKLLYRP